MCLSVGIFFRNAGIEKINPSILAWLIFSITTIMALFSFACNLDEINANNLKKEHCSLVEQVWQPPYF